ncbi:transketolase [Limibaculum sp. FT325]|uniref:transketolase n=1 Tax=Thermohalobaculum sediminis TaxID=2939436 RepID=UPI0020BEE17F|nr:transketolase [Limibaculum sediminis]MCL5775700.1 transketolase [Limibaculum sediminis]
MDIKAMKAAEPRLFGMATALRVLAMDAVEAANSGHPGMPMGMADVAAVLFDRHLRFDPKAPDWADRDRFVLSAGHGSMLLYGLLHLTGYPGMTLDELKNFRQLGAKTAGHPEYGHAAGIETTTGPLGQGLGNVVGMAMAEESLRARFGRKVIDHRTWVIASDGCLMEGISQEAIAFAGRQQLSRLIVLWDDNGISIDGKLDLSDRTDQLARFAASGWEVRRIDGHDYAQIDAAVAWAKGNARPTLIACRTHIGFGAPGKQDSAKAHGSPLGAKDIEGARAAYGWTHGAFEIPESIRKDWQAAAARGAEARKAWEAALAALSPARQKEFARVMAGEAPARLGRAVAALKKDVSEKAPKVATRKASEMALAAINPVMPETIGGSADLTGSNNTLTDGLGTFDETNRKGRYVYYGIREHGMAAAMNGMALHGGVVPYGGTFLVFSDYARPSMRLSALMGKRVIYVMTHDSIGLGEDGPTHQPVEHLAALRAIPNMLVFRPADAVETAEAWEIALTTPGTPSVLALTRQNLPTVRTRHTVKNLTAQGAYVLAEADHKRQAILLATGSEVEIALAARELLEKEGIGTRVVSAPSFELFAAQPEAYRKRVLPAGPVRVGVEAAVRQGWDRWLAGERGRDAKAAFVGMEGFGASAPYEKLYQHFGITPQAIAEKAKSLI